MEIALLVFILLIGPVSILTGRDSRVDEVGRRRTYLG
jgi:hypothetical protein